MKEYRKRDYPLDGIRRFLEPGPIVLVSSAWEGKTNIMTMGWHMMLGFSPALFGSYIWDGNHSFEMLRRSKECVINLPTTDLVDAVVGIGNCSGEEMDKFQKFGLTPVPSEQVKAPLIKECYANFECRLADASRDPALSAVHLGSRKGPCCHFSQVPKNSPLSWQRGVHGVGSINQPARKI